MVDPPETALEPIPGPGPVPGGPDNELLGVVIEDTWGDVMDEIGGGGGKGEAEGGKSLLSVRESCKADVGGGRSVLKCVGRSQYEATKN